MTCGIDWAEKHHDVALLDSDGKLLARRRISDDVAGWQALVELLAAHGDHADDGLGVQGGLASTRRPAMRGASGLAMVRSSSAVAARSPSAPP
ncbi:transposase [Actinomadura sp. NPDC048955]|uniref:IS110 family transposase n=1 Tax=Actinomadura sp. NPDC048955 TaxID=3158228 RepID=UPI0033E92849